MPDASELTAIGRTGGSLGATGRHHLPLRIRDAPTSETPVRATVNPVRGPLARINFSHIEPLGPLGQRLAHLERCLFWKRELQRADLVATYCSLSSRQADTAAITFRLEAFRPPRA